MGQRIGSVWVPDVARKFGWKQQQRREGHEGIGTEGEGRQEGDGGRASLRPALLHLATPVSPLSLCLSGVQVVEVGRPPGPMRPLYVCPRCGARRQQLFLASDGRGIVCRGVRCGNLRYESEYELKHPACSIERVKTLIQKSRQATTRKMRQHWMQKAEEAHEEYVQRAIQRSERHDAALLAWLVVQEAAHAEYIRQRDEPSAVLGARE